MLPSPKWNQSYSINNDLIDEQHQVLFLLIKKAYDLDDNFQKSDLKQIFLDLAEYAQVHFKDEEEYMQSIGYPKLEFHKTMHINFVKDVTKSLENYDSILEDHKSLDIVRKKLLFWIQNWLVNHILYQDLDIDKWKQSNR